MWNNDVSHNVGLEAYDVIDGVFVGLFRSKGGNEVVCFLILFVEKLNLLLEIHDFGNEATDAVNKKDIPADKTKAVHEMGVAGRAYYA
jgi:hypothetical protein